MKKGTDTVTRFQKDFFFFFFRSLSASQAAAYQGAEDWEEEEEDRNGRDEEAGLCKLFAPGPGSTKSWNPVPIRILNHNQCLGLSLCGSRSRF
jgi:hypothetical protein